jgi:hypothetical protein
MLTLPKSQTRSVPKTYLHNINVFILSGQFLFFLSIELDVVMETDNELEQKHKLDEVRFFIRNCNYSRACGSYHDFLTDGYF